MKTKILYTLLLVLFITSIAQAQTKHWGANALNAGAVAGSLDNIPTASLTDGDKAFTETEGISYVHWFDADGVTAESDPSVIHPNDNGGTGIWILQSSVVNALTTYGAIATGASQDITLSTDGEATLTVTGDGSNNFDESWSYDLDAVDNKAVHGGTATTHDYSALSGFDVPANAIDDTEIDWGTGASQVATSDVPIITGTGSPTVDELEEYFNNTGSSGFFTGGTITDATGGNINVAAGEGFIRTTASDVAQLVSFKWSASAGIDIPVDTTRYVFVDDAGSVTVNASEFTEAQDNIILGVATNVGDSTVYAFNFGVRLAESIGQAGRFIRRTAGIVKDIRRGGLAYGQSGDANRDVTMSTGNIWWGRTDYTMSAFDTSGADTFVAYSAGGLEDATASGWPNAQYDSSGTLTTMTNNRWANLFFYLSPDDTHIMMYGRSEFTSEALAEAEAVPSSSMPNRITAAGVLAARYTFQKSANTATIASAFETQFQGGAASDHGTLSGLSDDDHTQYLLADGTRALGGAWDMGSSATTNVNIDSGVITGITDLAVADGGTGASALTDLIALTTDTTGNYAAGDAEAGAATSGDAAVDFFGAGVDAVTDTTTCTDIEGRSLTIDTSILVADAELYTDTKCAYIESPVAESLETIWTTQTQAITITNVWCETDTGTVNMDLQIDDGSPADVMGTDLVCASTAVEDSSSLTGAMADGNRLDIVIASVATTPGRVSICWSFTRDD